MLGKLGKCQLPSINFVGSPRSPYLYLSPALENCRERNKMEDADAIAEALVLSKEKASCMSCMKCRCSITRGRHCGNVRKAWLPIFIRFCLLVAQLAKLSLSSDPDGGVRLMLSDDQFPLSLVWLHKSRQSTLL